MYRRPVARRRNLNPALPWHAALSRAHLWARRDPVSTSKPRRSAPDHGQDCSTARAIAELIAWRLWDGATVNFASKPRRVAYWVRDAMLWFLTVWILLVEVRHHRRRAGEATNSSG